MSLYPATTSPDPAGRRTVVSLASMNVRPVLDPLLGIEYVSVARRKPVAVRTAVPAKFQPRWTSGQFASYRDLRETVNGECAMTAFQYDLEDEDPSDATWAESFECPGCPHCDAYGDWTDSEIPDDFPW